MTFLSPMLLWLLVPWTALAVWMMWGRRSATRVPFLDLWRGSVAKPSVTRLFRPPPLAIVALLAAMLLGIVAAAEPIVTTGANRSPPVTIVLDRGITMSARGRSAEVIHSAELLLARYAPTSRVRVIAVPPIQHDLHWPGDAKSAPPTGIDTTEMIGPAIAEALRAGEHVLVLSDRAINPDPRVVQIAPTHAASNVGIVRFAIRERPALQAMVAIRNDSAETRATIRIDTTTQEIDLPPRGQTKSYFIDLLHVESISRAQLEVSDDLDIDNVACLTRQRDLPRIEMIPPLPREVVRVVRAYEKARPAGDAGARVVIASSPEDLPPDQPAAIVTSVGSSPAASNIARATIVGSDHPVMRGLDRSNAKLSTANPTFDPAFQPVLRINGRPAVGVTESPARRVLINFDMSPIVTEPEFVVLWTNTIDWLAQSGGETFAAKSLNDLNLTWMPTDDTTPMRPGIYRQADGASAAFNASPPDFPAPASRKRGLTWHNEFAAAPARFKLFPWLALGALLCASLAAYAWPGRRLTPVFSPRTV